MEFHQGNIYHIYNRGNNHQKIFFERKNYLFFLKKMRSHLLQHCHLLAWCLMPNHFHWMIQVHENYDSVEDPTVFENALPKIRPINRNISTILSSYTKAVNRMYDRSGSLFQKRTRSKNLSAEEHQGNDYPYICFSYIHQNPLKAGIVDKLENWEFSSFQDYTGVRPGKLCNKELTVKLLDLPRNKKDFTHFSYRTIPDDLVKKIKD